MKTIKSIYAFMISTSLIASCKTISEQPSLDKSLTGRWKFTSSSGGFAGKTVHADSANSIFLLFKKDGSYIKTQNADTLDKGVYEWTRTKSIYTGHEENAIHLFKSQESSEKPVIVNIENDTLTIADNFYDGFTSKYIRIE